MQNNVTILNKPSSKYGTHQQKRSSTKLENYQSIKIKDKASGKVDKQDDEDKEYKNRYIEDISMYLTACLREDIPLDSGHLDPHAFDQKLYCQSVNHLIGEECLLSKISRFCFNLLLFDKEIGCRIRRLQRNEEVQSGFEKIRSAYIILSGKVQMTQIQDQSNAGNTTLLTVGDTFYQQAITQAHTLDATGSNFLQV